MTVDEIRSTIIAAIASDDNLQERLVLKGGNALELIHKIGQRASLDIDFSLDGDFEDLEDARVRLFQALRQQFETAGYVLFDEMFAPRPKSRSPGDRWGGYNAEFKLIERKTFEKLAGKRDDIRRQATESGPNQQRKFKIEISAFEYCEGSIEAPINDYVCRVYSVEMIAVEKLRAICQQSANYVQRAHPAPRARDFYDIYVAVNEGRIDFASPRIHEQIRRVFRAKEVDLSLILQIHEQREFHRSDWPSVVNAVRIKLRQFDYYFEFVLAELEKLQPLWVV